MHKEYDLTRLLTEAYIKVLRVNLTTDTYDEIKVIDAERDMAHGYYAETISGWLSNFAEAGNVYIEDRGRYMVFAQIDSLRRVFKAGDEKISVLYRRRNDKGTYRWARMTIQRSYDYTDENQIVMLYVEDVHEIIDMTYEVAEQQQITHALTHMYFICLYVDLDDCTYRRIHVAKGFEQGLPERGTMSDMISVNVTQVVMPLDHDTLMENFTLEQIRHKLTTQRSYEYTYRARTAQGEIWCRVVATRVNRHGDGRPRHIIIAMQDVTDRMKQAAEME